jgi:hypothetical protein
MSKEGFKVGDIVKWDSSYLSKSGIWGFGTIEAVAESEKRTGYIIYRIRFFHLEIPAGSTGAFSWWKPGDSYSLSGKGFCLVSKAGKPNQ